MDPMRALEKIWLIVHTPSGKRKAQDHFMADFDEIRGVIKPFIDAGFIDDPNSPNPKQDQQ